jgi:hypothetical protein
VNVGRPSYIDASETTALGIISAGSNAKTAIRMRPPRERESPGAEVLRKDNSKSYESIPAPFDRFLDAFTAEYAESAEN